MKRVKEGDIVTIDGVQYEFGETSPAAYNALAAMAESGSPIPEERNIHLNRVGESTGWLFSFEQIREALEGKEFSPSI